MTTNKQNARAASASEQDLALRSEAVEEFKIRWKQILIDLAMFRFVRPSWLKEDDERITIQFQVFLAPKNKQVFDKQHPAFASFLDGKFF